MNKTITIIVSVVLAVCCLGAVVVSATGGIGVPQSEEIPKTVINSDKVYFSYYNSDSQKGAIAFCLDNRFTAYGSGEGKIQLCTKNDDGTYTALYSIEKGNIDTRFYGRSEHSLSTDSSKAGGLSSIGITFDYSKTNVCFLLYNQSVEKGTTYFIYIPENYFLDENGNPNAGAYIEIPASKTNNYTGKLAEDLENLFDKVYDVALFSVESVHGMLF